MSSPVYCETCGCTGHRRMGHIAPEGWFYAEFKDKDDPTDSFIIMACSEACCKVTWLKGPGKLDLTKEV